MGALLLTCYYHASNCKTCRLLQIVFLSSAIVSTDPSGRYLDPHIGAILLLGNTCDLSTLHQLAILIGVLLTISSQLLLGLLAEGCTSSGPYIQVIHLYSIDLAYLVGSQDLVYCGSFR